MEESTSAGSTDFLSAFFQSLMTIPFVIADSVLAENMKYFNMFFGDPAKRNRERKRQYYLTRAKAILASATHPGEIAAAKHYIETMGNR